MIIVGTDFSTGSARALQKARLLAARLGEDLELVHVRNALEEGPWLPDHHQEDWLTAAGESSEDLTILKGTPWVEIVRIATERNADFVVIGTHGSSGFHTLSVGTTATRLALICPCLTLLVGQHL